LCVLGQRNPPFLVLRVRRVQPQLGATSLQ
jgi:hypothetical protein